MSALSKDRLRLFAVWLAVFARALGENAVRAFAILRMSDGAREFTPAFLFMMLGMAAVPAFALAPMIGAIASSRYRGLVMVLATMTGLGIIGYSAYEEYSLGRAFWVGCIAILAFEGAFFSASRFSLLPEAARTCHLRLPHVVGGFAIASCLGIGLGLSVGYLQFDVGRPGLPMPLRYGFVGYGAALALLLLARFPVAAPVPVKNGLVKPFLRTGIAIFRRRNGRSSLLTLWGVFAIGVAIQQWLMPHDSPYFFFLALLIGLVVGSLQPNAFRTTGMVPFAGIGLFVSVLWCYLTNDWSVIAFGTAGYLGLMLPGLLTTFTIYQPDETRGHGAALLHAGWSVIVGGFITLLVGHLNNPAASRPLISNMVLGLSIVGAIFAWLMFFRPAFEFFWEVVLWPIYRVKAYGPGVNEFPWKGPVLVIANHAAWFDPLWMNKVLPFPARPMMTSKFYDMRALRWIFSHVIDAIRVPDSAARKEAPELEQAINNVLDAGDCLIVFPEGWLRRREDQELRRFARGVWHILEARPNTPVFPCWIDGNWESMFSHKGGPPMKGKKLDWWHKIRVGVGPPLLLDAETLKKHMKTRMALMQAVVDARQYLGLPPIDPFKIPEKTDDGEEPGE